MIEFIAIGQPKTKGSTKSFVPKRKDGSEVRRTNGNVMVVTMNDVGPSAEIWAATVAREAHLAMLEARVGMARGPIAVKVGFFVPRNKGHFGTGRNANVLKDSAPVVPAVKPDVDKWVRLVLDAMTGVVYADDGQVVELIATKNFGEPARAEIAISLYEPSREDAQLALAC